MQVLIHIIERRSYNNAASSRFVADSVVIIVIRSLRHFLPAVTEAGFVIASTLHDIVQ